MERSSQCADGGNGSGMNVGFRGGGNAAGEGRSIQFVVGMQNERDVQRFSRDFVGHLAVQHVQEIRCKTAIILRGQQFLTGANIVPIRHDGRQLGDQPGRLTDIRFPGIVIDVRIPHGQQRHRGAQHFHRTCFLGELLHQLDELRRKCAVAAQFLVEFFQLG
jgi:hypothetical protein